MTTKVEKNKRAKETSLYKAAYELFTAQGINETSINDIAKKAGVGKGTFYLYFNDKYDILDRIILKKSSEVLCLAIKETDQKEFTSFESELLFFIDYIIEYLKKDKLMLKLIHKNLSWGVLKKAKEDVYELEKIYIMFEKGYKDRGVSEEYIKKILFMIIELVGSISYSAIILNEPTDMDSMKPLLFETIKKII